MRSSPKICPSVIYAFKRLALGILLIALASAILLVADRERRTPAERRALRIAVFQHSDSAIMEDGVRGMAFIEAVVKSSKGNAKWTRLDI